MSDRFGTFSSQSGRKKKMLKYTNWTIAFAVILGMSSASVSHAATYNLNVAYDGSILSTPVGTVDITGNGTTLTYQFELTSGSLSAVYMDVTGTVSSVSDGVGTSDQHATVPPTSLGNFTDWFGIPLSQRGPDLTVTFTGSNLAAGYTLLGNTEMFSAANTSFGFFGDTPTTPLPATLPLFAGGLAGLGLLAKRRKRKSATAIAVV